MGQGQGYVFNGGAWIPSESMANVPLRAEQATPEQAMPVGMPAARSVSVHPGYGYPPGYVVMRPSTQPSASGGLESEARWPRTGGEPALREPGATRRHVQPRSLILSYKDLSVPECL